MVGASSAGPAIHLALGSLLNEQGRTAVKAWLNLGGILKGTPLVEFLQNPPQSWLFNLVTWYENWSHEAIISLSATRSRPRFEQIPALPDLLIINYLGVPLSGQLSRFGVDKYPILRDKVPNDGLTLLTDVIAPKSLTIVAFGSDHFFAEDPLIDSKTVAMMKLLVAYLEKQTHKSCR